MGPLASRSKRIVWLVAVLVGGPALLFVGVMLYIFLDEGDQVYWSRLYLAKQQITAVETAAESFRKEYGSYPADLQELVHPARNGGNKKFLTRMAPNPWGGPFRYEIEHGGGGESIKIWVVPDRKTQDKTGLSELSNKTQWQAILKQ